MNWKKLYTILALFLGGLILASNSNGRAAGANEGNTGAPGDNAPGGRICQTCHNSAAIQVTLGIEVIDPAGNTVVSYVPGQVYTVKVIINPVVGTPAAYGFQLVGEVNETKVSTNSFSAPSANAKLASISNGRQYAEHKSPSETNQFTVQWTAPAVGTGNVTFYSAGNGVNFNGQSSGDGASKNSLTLTEETGSSTYEANGALPLEIFPNPAYDFVQISGAAAFNGGYVARVMDLNGRVLREQTLSGPIAVGDLLPGVYIIQVVGEGKMRSARLYKR